VELFINVMELISVLNPLVTADQFVPLLVVLIITPPSPAAKPLSESIKYTERRSAVVPVVNSTQPEYTILRGRLNAIMSNKYFFMFSN
jgi:hypothetical protein